MAGESKRIMKKKAIRRANSGVSVKEIEEELGPFYVSFKRKLHKLHFIFRAKQRFGWELTEKEVDELRELVVQGKLEKVRQDTKNVVIYKYASRILVYSRKAKTFLTCYEENDFNCIKL